MDMLIRFGEAFLAQLGSPTLGFLAGGFVLAAFRSKLAIPDAVYRFIVFVLLVSIGLKGGMEIRNANLGDVILPALVAVLVGAGAVLLGRVTLAKLPGVRVEDALATAGLFGAVSASTLAAAMLALEREGMAFEAWVPALYPFMDIPALLMAIVLAGLGQRRKEGGGAPVNARQLIVDSLRSSAVSAMLLGLLLGLVSRPEAVYESFYKPLFPGLLSVLMFILGAEAYSQIADLRRTAHWYLLYAFFAPIAHGLIAFGLGFLVHRWTGFSPGGVVLLAILAASSSDISGPPTLRAAIPKANPSCYIGASTGIGTPVALAICIPFFVALGQFVF